MRCEEVRFRFEETSPEALSEEVREHLAQCADCRAYARDWRLARAGFLALAGEAVPDPSLGFATRVLRRLEESLEPAQFLELAGRRMVYAGLLLALMLLLALALPASGPLRGPTTAELYWAQPDTTTLTSDAIFPDESLDGRELKSQAPEANGAEGKR